jgi:hypothetical protein
MEYFTKPEYLDGAILIQELSANGVEVKEITLEADLTVSMDIPKALADKAKKVVDSHKGAPLEA